MPPLETRSFERFELHIPVKYEFKDAAMKNRFGSVKQEGAVYDVSLGGISIITKTFAPKGIVLKLYMRFQLEEEKEIEAEGEIRSVIPWAGGNNRFGIQFIDLDKKSQDIIREFIKKNERRTEPRLNIKDIKKE